MKNTIITLVFAVVVCNLFTLDMVNPAWEMSGKYLRFATCTQKSFMEYDDGFNEFTISISKPYIWKNCAISGNAQIIGDGVYKKINWNIAPGITLYDRLTLAVSLGGIHTSLDNDDLIFGEHETVGNYSLSQPNIGASIIADIWNEKMEFSVLSSYLNQPEINFIDKDEKQDLLLATALLWNITPSYQVGLSYKNEDNESYFGFNFNFKFPYENISHNLLVNQELVTYKPSIKLFNYWEIGLGYNLYHDSNLGYQNIEVDIAYEYTGKQTPIVRAEPVDETKETTVNFTLSGADRFSKIQVSCNKYVVFDERDVWNANGKEYSVSVHLKDGDNDIQIVAKSSTGVETTSNQYLYVEPQIINIHETDKIEIKDESILEEDTQTDIPEKIDEKAENPYGILKPRPEYVSNQTPGDYLEADLVIVNMPQDYNVPEDHPYLYSVKKGDNLWDISNKKNVYGNPLKWINIYSKNGIATPNPNHLYPGQILYIDNSSEPQRVLFYEIQQGDTCFNIARKLENSDGRHLLIVSNIEKILTPHMIMPGKKIMIKIFRVE